MQLAAKVRKDFLKVDRFWRTFLTNHSKYNPLPLDQLAPIESPAPFTVDNKSYLKNNQIVQISQNDVGVQTLDITNLIAKSNPNSNGFPFLEMNGTISDLSIEEVKIESVEVYQNVECDFTDSNFHCDDSNDYPIGSDGEETGEDSKDPTSQISDQYVTDICMKRRSSRKYPKNRNIHGIDPMKGEEKLLKCFDHECKQGKFW